MTIVPTMLYEGTLGPCQAAYRYIQELMPPLCPPAVLGIPMCYYGGPLGGGFFVDTVAPRIAMGYSVVAALMNVICTFLICGRILYVSGAFSVFLNGGTPDDLSSRRSTQDSRIFLYRLAAMMVVDSMLPHTLFGAAYVLALALGSPVYILFLSLYVMFTVCALVFLFRGLVADIGTLVHISPKNPSVPLPPDADASCGHGL